MTVEELLRKQAADPGGQLSRAIAGLSDVDADKQPIPNVMPVREMIEHLCEAYHAVKVTAAGEKHEWGSYASGAENWAHLQDHFGSLREAAIEAGLEKSPSSITMEGSDTNFCAMATACRGSLWLSWKV